MNYQETLEYMFKSLPMFHRMGKAAYKANLDNTLALDSHFNHPHKKFKTIHIAGTNGKGSVSHMLASVLQEAGYKTGLYTSPHLKDFRERIKINGVMISEKYVTDFISQNIPFFEEIKPSFFEMTVTLAFDYFAKENTDVAVIEVGLGGRLDSTNIITPELSVITNISFDHTGLLGGTLAKIAAEKAGIIKKNIPVLIGETHEEIKGVFIEKAKKNKAPVYFAEEVMSAKYLSGDLHQQSFSISKKDKIIYENISIDLTGLYQNKNIVTVISALELLIEKGFSIDKKAIYKGLKNAAAKTGLMGRWQVLGEKPLIICDTGHNEAGIKEISKQFHSLNVKKLHIIIGTVNDKDIDPMLSQLPRNAIYYFTKAQIPRALDVQILAEKAAKFNLAGNIYSSVKEAFLIAKLQASENDMIFIGGSTFIVAEVL